MSEVYRPQFRDIRPIKPHEKELQRREIKMYEVNGMPGHWNMQSDERPVEANVTAGGLLLVAFLE